MVIGYVVGLLDIYFKDMKRVYLVWYRCKMSPFFHAYLFSLLPILPVKLGVRSVQYTSVNGNTRKVHLAPKVATTAILLPTALLCGFMVGGRVIHTVYDIMVCTG